jgi:uncharacterized membrane protein YoaK (UPF0700 family)
MRGLPSERWIPLFAILLANIFAICAHTFYRGGIPDWALLFYVLLIAASFVPAILEYRRKKQADVQTR